MQSFKSTLFLGISKTESIEKKLALTKPELVAMFFASDGTYLSEIEYAGVCYIGKSVGDIVDLRELTLIEANICSLLEKLLPDLTKPEKTLKLVAIRT